MIQSALISLSTSSDLWVADLDLASPVTQKLDFYLNYQLTRVLFREPQAPEAEAADIVQKLELGRYLPTLPSSPKDSLVLIDAESNLLAKWVLFVNFRDPQWGQKLVATWERLQKPSSKVFLPPYLKEEQLLEVWPPESLPLVFQDIV